MNLYSLPPLLAAAANLILGIIVYRKNRRQLANKLFLLLSLCYALWNFFTFLLFGDLSKSTALLFAKIVQIPVIWIVPFLLHLILTTLSIKKRVLFAIIYLLAIIFSIANISDLFINRVIIVPYSSKAFAFYGQGGPLYPLFVAYIVCISSYSALCLWRALKRTSGLKHIQIRYLLIALIIAIIGGVNDMLPIIGIHKYPLANANFYPFGSVTIIFWSLIIAYAIVKHHLMDIDIVIKKGMVYAYLSFSVLLPSALIIIFAQKYFFGHTNKFFSFLAFCTLLLASLVILRVKPEIENYIEKKLFTRTYEYKKTLRELSEIIISFLDEKELFKKAGAILTKDLGAEKGSCFLLDRQKKAYTLRASQNIKKSKIRELPQRDQFFKWLEVQGHAVVKEVLERSVDDPTIKHVVERLNAMESEVCLPLMTRDALIGIINLGHKRSGEMYSHEDLDLLTHFATQASVALENARLYNEMQQTQQLMRRTDRLSSLGSLTANLAHEIRNPLVTVKTFLELVPERYKEKEFRDDYRKLASSELDRISTLVTQLLSFARPKKPHFRKRDINKVLEEVLYLITVEATKRDIAFETNLQETPQTRLDEDQMKQVFLNIFLNAMEAISAHGRISVSSRNIQKNGTQYVQVEIADTGKGIPKKLVEQIFDPFFTTKEKGSGLGLSISHQIVQDHHGTIEVASKPKRGTTFLVNIPAES